jgi:predicted secreted protein
MGYTTANMKLTWVFLKQKYVFFLICVLLIGAPTMVKAEEKKGPYMPTNSIITVKIEDSGKEVSLKKGDTIQIELKTFGTAGYTWQFDDLDEGYLETVSRETKPVSDRMGAPTLCIWLLKARKSGSTKITMSNYRVWEGREKAVAEFSLAVKIE